MRTFRAVQRATAFRHLGYTLPALACLILMLSCATSPSPSPEAGVTASTTLLVQTTAPTALIPTAAASPVPSTVVSPLQTATAVIPTATRATPTASPVSPTVVSPLPTATPVASVPICTVRVIGVFPHDRAAYTQGLVYEKGGFYEGTGLWGESTLRRVDLESGEVLQAHSLPPEYFGEGIAVWEDRIIQLTWKSRQGFVYDKESFELLDTFEYPTEGWGITHDGDKLIMSDGTPTLYFWDPETLAQIGSLEVYASAGPVTRLNELEYVQGMVLANVWQTDLIAVIDPRMGQVAAWIDLGGLLEPEDHSEPVDVLNGIAYDASGERLFVTGKLWPKLFEIKLISPTGAPAPLTCK